MLRILEHFDSKARVEDYIEEKAGSMTWNSIRIAGYFNNFLTLWKPKKQDDGSYVIDLPMEGKPIYGMDVDDIGECVASKIMLATDCGCGCEDNGGACWWR